jgi:tetratricopeptide (TPR) repeat protein
LSVALHKLRTLIALDCFANYSPEWAPIGLKSGIPIADSVAKPMISVTRIFRLGIRLAVWATPHVKEWHRKRNLNVSEAERHMGSRNWSEAEKYLAAALCERRYSSKRRVGFLLDLERAQRKQSKLDQAEQTARTAIELAAQVGDHALRAKAMEGLVDVQITQQKYSDAEQTIREIASLEAAQSRPDRARLATCARKLGTALLKSGRNDEAFEAFQQAASLAEQAFGADHLETAQSLSQLGMLSRQHGNHGEAQRCLRRALEIHRATSGPESNATTEALYNLAASLEQSGDLAGAMSEYERVLALKDRQVGGNREEATEVQVHLAALYVKAGRIAPARELLMQAIATLERKGGPPLARALETFADVEERTGHTQEARQWRERAAEIAAAPVS